MLERTVGCLETSSIRRILLPSRRVVESRRDLRPAFWNHAACDLELSPSWSTILPDADARQVEMSASVEQKDSGLNGGLWLDFLYPAGTLNHLRNHSSWGLKRGRRIGRSRLPNLGQRLYASSAVDTPPTGTPASGNSLSKPDDSNSHATQIIEPTMKNLRDRMGLFKSDDYDKAWQQYNQMDTDEQKLLRKMLIVYYSTSKRDIDAERSLELFGALAVGERDATAFQNAIRSFLRLRKIQEALEMNKRATKSLCIPVGSDRIFSYFVKKHYWTRACTVWWELKQWELLHPDATYNLYAALDRHTTIDYLAYRCINYLNERYDQLNLATNQPQPALLDFATDLARRAFDEEEDFDDVNLRTFPTIFEHVHKWGVLTSYRCEQVFRRLLFLRHTALVVKCYRMLREGNGFFFTGSTLIALLKTFCVMDQGAHGIKQVMEDFYTYHGGPFPDAYKLCMTKYAAIGDVKRVHDLFQQFMDIETKRYRGTQPLTDPGFLAPLLQVHSKRGEIAEVIKIFDSISEDYGLQPNILCWNILIATYARLHDVDGAMACYQQLLDMDLKPDGYTIGTLMGMATVRGDVESVMSLWRAADDLKLKKSAAMVDSLVLTYIREDKIAAAEEICKDAVNMDLTGTRTRMWNYLIVGYAQQRDLLNTNRILQRMVKLQIPQDGFTYAALMQSLAMNKQPDKAYAIIRDVLPKAGIKATVYHYAVVMGGYLATNNIPRIFRIYGYVLRRLGEQGKAASVNALLLRAAASRDDWLLARGTAEEKFKRSMEMFLSITFDPADMARTPSRKGISSLPLDIAYKASIHGFVMMNLARHSEVQSVEDVYQRYLSAIPEDRRQDNPPNVIITALMESKFRDRDREGVLECWDMVLANARAFKKRVTVVSPDGSSTTEEHQVLYQHQLDLSKNVSMYLKALAWESSSSNEIIATVDGLLKEGFVLDSENMNKYVQILLDLSRVKKAFQVCEEKLMSGFTGWTIPRRKLGGPRRFAPNIPNKNLLRRRLRPQHTTQIALEKAYVFIRESAMESVAHQFWLEDLERLYPETCHMIKTMPRIQDPMELLLLRDV